MNIKLTNKRARQGIMIFELMVYLAIFFVVLGLATEAFFQCFGASSAFRREADEISRSLEAGERWRADVRHASGPIESASTNGSEIIRIPQAEGEVVYSFGGSELRRRPATGREAVVLSHIKSSQMQPETAAFGVIWRWELELASKQIKHQKVRPLFSFEAVAALGKAP